MRGHIKLAAFTDRWKKDPRPWAREQMLEYIGMPLSSMDHQPVIKRLFKHAEENKDDEVMGAFFVAFDRLVRYKRIKGYSWDQEARQYIEQERLTLPRNTVPLKATQQYTDWRGKKFELPVATPDDAMLFTYKTRYYLRRRVWRYFRWMAYQRPDDYVTAIVGALKRYVDEDFEKGEHILESWSLMQACFREHDALEFGTAHVRLKEGRGLSELTPAPRFLDHWKKEGVGDQLFQLLSQAKSRLVRVWTMQLLEREHTEWLRTLEPLQLLPLISHADEEIQQFGAELLDKTPGVDKLPVADWLRLLDTDNPTALALICELMGKHVTAERLELADCIDLTSSEAAPVAGMGLEFIKQRSITTPEDRDAITHVANAKCAAFGRDIAAWALGILGTKENYITEQVSMFFDSLLEESREAAWGWLTTDDAPGYNDAALWSRLLETSYDNLRQRIIDLLQHRADEARIAGRNGKPAALPGAKNEDLTPIWTSVLLNVHRGGRQKLKAMRQISDVVRDDPGRMETLLPVLAVAIRSVRPAEARPGLAAIVSVIETHPSLMSAVTKHLPELQFESAGGAN